jgi:hypothetical protein
VNRMITIKTHLGCRFLRYNEKINELVEYWQTTGNQEGKRV